MKNFRRDGRAIATILRLESMLLFDAIDTEEGAASVFNMEDDRWCSVEVAVNEWAKEQNIKIITGGSTDENTTEIRVEPIHDEE